MEAKKYVIAILMLALWPALIFAYDNTKTHPMLTGMAVDLFGASTGRSLVGSDKQAIINGSIEEDADPRYLEHFYDPINKVGLGHGLFSASKDWAQDRTRVTNSFTWNEAVYQYTYGDKSKGLSILGHILHLIQDKTVPEHTRDDPHPMVSTYETFAKTQNSVPSTQPIYLNSLDDYFDQVAKFTNTNFFSDDTILNDYPEPKITKEIESGEGYLFGMNNSGAKIVSIKREIEKYSNKIYTNYSLVDKDNKIMSDYWNTLAPRAVGYSAGVIKLFFDEVKKEQETHALQLAREPWWQKLLDLAKVRIDQALALVKVSTHTKVDTITLATRQTDQPPENIELNTPNPSPTLAELEARLQNLRTQLEVLIKDSKPEQVLTVIGSINHTLADVGLPSIDPAESTTTDDKIVVSAPQITFPADFSQPFATTTIVFSGTAATGTIVSSDFSAETSTASESGQWSLTLSNLPQGSSTISFTASNESGKRSSPTKVSFIVDTLPLSINLSVLDCQTEAIARSSDGCLLKATNTLALRWQLSKAGDYKYDVIKTYLNDNYDWEEKVVLSASTTDELLVDSEIPDGEYFTTFYWQVIAHDASTSEIVVTSSKIKTDLHVSPLMINEIGWVGTVASDRDEWLELYNPSGQLIDLNNFYLTFGTSDTRINLVGSINPSSYYLIERGSDEVISNRPANLIDGFGSPLEVKAFDTTNLNFKLWQKRFPNDVLIEETPMWNKSGSTPSSLERVGFYGKSNEVSNWQDNLGCNLTDGPCALDRNATTTFGTPKVKNWASIPRMI